MKKERLEIGDTVQVMFNNSQFTLSLKATLLRFPDATGDSWVFRDEETGWLHYVSEGCTVSGNPAAQLSRPGADEKV
jgi:hypothetical protein